MVRSSCQYTPSTRTTSQFITREIYHHPPTTRDGFLITTSEVCDSGPKAQQQYLLSQTTAPLSLTKLAGLMQNNKQAETASEWKLGSSRVNIHPSEYPGQPSLCNPALLSNRGQLPGKAGCGRCGLCRPRGKGDSPGLSADLTLSSRKQALPERQIWYHNEEGISHKVKLSLWEQRSTPVYTTHYRESWFTVT